MTLPSIQGFLLKLGAFSLVLFGIHFYLLNQFFEGELYFPIWSIYLFNIILVLAVYLILYYQTKKGSKKIYFTFMALTILKMALAVVFLSPLFFEKAEHSQLEIGNFFVVYFLFLTFEIFSINKFLLKT